MPEGGRIGDLRRVDEEGVTICVVLQLHRLGARAGDRRGQAVPARPRAVRNCASVKRCSFLLRSQNTVGPDGSRSQCRRLETRGGAYHHLGMLVLEPEVPVFRPITPSARDASVCSCRKGGFQRPLMRTVRISGSGYSRQCVSALDQRPRPTPALVPSSCGIHSLRQPSTPARQHAQSSGSSASRWAPRLRARRMLIPALGDLSSARHAAQPRVASVSPQLLS